MTLVDNDPPHQTSFRFAEEEKKEVNFCLAGSSASFDRLISSFLAADVQAGLADLPSSFACRSWLQDFIQTSVLFLKFVSIEQRD